MACGEDVEDFGRLNGAQLEVEVDPVVPEAEVDPAPPPETSEGPLAAPAPKSEDPPEAATEPAAEEPMVAAGSSQVA
jgi:hypothetical protein